MPPRSSSSQPCGAKRSNGWRVEMNPYVGGATRNEETKPLPRKVVHRFQNLLRGQGIRPKTVRPLLLNRRHERQRSHPPRDRHHGQRVAAFCPRPDRRTLHRRTTTRTRRTQRTAHRPHPCPDHPHPGQHRDPRSRPARPRSPHHDLAAGTPWLRVEPGRRRTARGDPHGARTDRLAGVGRRRHLTAAGDRDPPPKAKSSPPCSTLWWRRTRPTNRHRADRSVPAPPAGCAAAARRGRCAAPTH
ncbi:hypothetical protein C8D81_1155 [Enemella evansiae]|nr:hypothetical protein C8D81_1155 [Enemella evansiae]